MIESIRISVDLSQRNDVSPYDVYLWCAKQFGTENIVWRRAISGNYPMYTFLNEKDAVLFTLRWQ